MYDNDDTHFSARERSRRNRRNRHQTRQEGHPGQQSYDASSTVGVMSYGEDINPLIQLANPLLAIGIGLSRQEIPPDIYQLKDLLTQRIKYFQQQCGNILKDSVDDATYILCTFLDENIMRRPWGSSWGEKPLLLDICHDNQGGEKFFIKLKEIQHQLTRVNNNASRDGLVYLLELIYVCLSFGFIGKYEIIGQTQKLGDVKVELYRFIDNYRHFSHSDDPLSLHWQGTATKKIKSRWQYAALALVLLVGTFFGMYYYYFNDLGNRKVEVFNQLDIAQSDLKVIDSDYEFKINMAEPIPIKPSIIDYKPYVEPAKKELLKKVEFVFFKTGKYKLDASAKRKINSFLNKLNELCNKLEKGAKPTITIELLGRASSIGSVKYNQWISKERADATKKYLDNQDKSCFFVKPILGKGLGIGRKSKEGNKSKAQMNQSVEIRVTEVNSKRGN